MALETLRGLKQVGGFEVKLEKWAHPFHHFIEINHDDNAITFKIQNGPVKDNGVNGCQVDTIIETAKLILEGLDDKFPSEWNLKAIQKLNATLDCLRLRRVDRTRRGVEGTDQP